MIFDIWDPEGVVPPDLERAVMAAEHISRRVAWKPNFPVCPETVLLLGDGPDLEDRVGRARGLIGEAVLITLRRGRDSARTARLIGLGADDDLSLPVQVSELIARVGAVRRAHGRGFEGVQTFCGVTVFSDGRPPEVDGTPLQLSAQEGRLLSHLLRTPGRPVSRETLHRALYAMSDLSPAERVIDVHVCNLRRKLRRSLGDRSPLISTARGLGYVVSDPEG